MSHISNLAEDTNINSIIGESTRLRGSLDLSGLLRIDGDFTGTIRTVGKVLIGRHGRAECTIVADSVVIGGVLRGDVVAASQVIALASAVIFGTISAPRFIAEEGARCNCQFVIRPGVARRLEEVSMAPLRR